MTYPLGRLLHHDPQNKQHRALVMPPPRSALPNVSWYTRDVYDQGQTSSCTAQAAVGLLRTNPFRRNLTEWSTLDTQDERQSLYREAQKNDPWDGENYEGTSTDAPFKVLRERGAITGWRWLFGEEEMREFVTWYGPVSVGTTWTSGMFEPNPLTGYITPTGMSAGGHAYRIINYNAKREAYRLVNSWGRGWGQYGRAWIKRQDMAALLEDQGEVVTIA